MTLTLRDKILQMPYKIPKLSHLENLFMVRENLKLKFLRAYFFAFVSQINRSKESISNQPVPSSQDFNSYSKTQTLFSDKSIFCRKLGSASLDESLFEDLLTSKDPFSNIQDISEKIRVQGRTNLSAEPPRWDTPPATFFTYRKNISQIVGDDKLETPPPVFDLTGGNKDGQNGSDSDADKQLS